MLIHSAVVCKEEVVMRIRELQKLIPNSTTLDVDRVLDEAIEYVKSLQSEHRALLEAIRSLGIALAAHIAMLQRLQHPMGPTINQGSSIHNDRPTMSCYSHAPLFPSSSLAVAHSPSLRPSMLPLMQETAALPGHTTPLPHPPLNLQYGIPVMPCQSSLVAGNLPTWPHNVQTPAPNQEEDIN